MGPRGREEANQSIAQMGERTRVSENRVREIENEFQMAVSSFTDNSQFSVGHTRALKSSIDNILLLLQANDVVVRTTAARVEEVTKRTDVLETNCQYWMPHAVAMERVATKIEEKLRTIHKEMKTNVAEAASAPEKLRVEVQEIVKTAIQTNVATSTMAKGAGTPGLGHPCQMVDAMGKPLSGGSQMGAYRAMSPRPTVVVANKQFAAVRSTTSSSSATAKAANCCGIAGNTVLPGVVTASTIVNTVVSPPTVSRQTGER